MKIKSTLLFNTSLYADHSGTANGIGSNIPENVVIPAGATLELEDGLWKRLGKSANELVENGSLVIIEAPKLSEEEQKAADEAELAAIEARGAELKKKKAPAKKTAVSKTVSGE